jgi:tetratricopeptide (TPR) repeat protein
MESQGRFAEAEPLFLKALTINVKALGENHPETARSYGNIAGNLDAQGRFDEAVRNWAKAAEVFEQSRHYRSASGLERSLTAQRSPFTALAVGLVRQGKRREAWSRWEADLARGLLDDLSACQFRPLSADQRHREANLACQIQRVDEQIARLTARAKRTQEEDKQLESLRNQQNILRGQFVEFENALDQQYQTYAGKPSSLEEIQRALPPAAALVGWLDVKTQHWACVVPKTGDPAWVRIPGSGKEGAWTEEDKQRGRRLREAPANNQSTWRKLAAEVSWQRLGPLWPHLTQIKHLIVLPSAGLAGIPIETLSETN